MSGSSSEQGSYDNPVRFKDQDYDTLLQNCLKSGVLFSDPIFPANQSSLGVPVDPDPKKTAKWLRPKDNGITPYCTSQKTNHPNAPWRHVRYQRNIRLWQHSHSFLLIMQMPPIFFYPDLPHNA
ncbi:hypothetical protein IRJ41_018364 [Triplophysa rosa]|uniref:Calpain catalytic domain-containing protein n=1 Tax=Triplophysa rosa TaxID=992332 RepID=A0A9W7WK90_TRIRA|nr:hypothetical protein IRJ41_018364 [Triplophysa rosa]